MSQKIVIGADHAGFEYKTELAEMLKQQGYEVKDFGPFSADSVDYPDFAHPVAQTVENNEADFGVLICGSGQGVCMVANKHQGVRAALVWNRQIAAMAREHNNANIICIPSRHISLHLAKECVEDFLKTPFEGGRHERRVNKISC